MTENKDWTTAFDKTGAVCSILGLFAVFFLQDYKQDDITLLFWWITTAIIAFASVITFFHSPSLIVRVVFVLLFISQIPLFNSSWNEISDDNTQYEISLLGGNEDDLQKQNTELQNQYLSLKRKWYESFLFWESISHLIGMAFALLACTNTGQYRIRVIYELGERSS